MLRVEALVAFEEARAGPGWCVLWGLDAYAWNHRSVLNVRMCVGGSHVPMYPTRTTVPADGEMAARCSVTRTLLLIQPKLTIANLKLVPASSIESARKRRTVEKRSNRREPIYPCSEDEQSFEEVPCEILSARKTGIFLLSTYYSFLVPCFRADATQSSMKQSLSSTLITAL